MVTIGWSWNTGHVMRIIRDKYYFIGLSVLFNYGIVRADYKTLYTHSYKEVNNTHKLQRVQLCTSHNYIVPTIMINTNVNYEITLNS